MKVFVSYTRRDGAVTNSLLQSLHSFLAEVCEPFVHAIEEPHLRHQQLGVFLALLRCHLIVLIVSPGYAHSPWVRLEILLGRMLFRPIIRINANDIRGLRGEA